MMDSNIINTAEGVLAMREDFFTRLVSVLTQEPGNMDKMLRQASYYVPPNLSTLINDTVLGDFYIKVEPSFSGVSWDVAYSLWQIGTNLKIALIIEDHPKFGELLSSEELDLIWDKKPDVHTRGSTNFIEWSFIEPEFFHSFAIRERYILGVRHMHFRTLRMLKKLSVADEK